MPERASVLARQPKSPAPQPRRRRLIAYIVVALVAVLVVGAAGWWINNWVNPTPTVHATTGESFTGKMVEISQGSSGGCMIPDGTSRRVCSLLLPVDENMPALHVGQHVTAAHTRLYTGRAYGYDVLLVYPAK